MLPSPGPSADRFLPGEILADRYRVIERVGAGGMGEVYRAHDLKLGQAVALKFLPPGLSDEPDRLGGLVAEVRVAREVSHPNVCRVHDIVEASGVRFLTMEFVDGEDLASLLRRIGRLPPDKAIEIAREVCAGLAAIHERGVLHRDLKPANVMIDGRGHARITDFGLAEMRDAPSDPEMIVGTPAYLAPEALAGGAPTVQRDLYGLGLVMYELFTGRHAFPGETAAEIGRHRAEGKLLPPSSLVRDLDPRVEEVILRCLERDPDRRPTSALGVAAALPGSDPLAAAMNAGETPSPELVAAVGATKEGLGPAMAWSFLAALVLGVALLTTLSPRSRLVPSLSFPDPPEAMAARARALLSGLGPSERVADRAFGYEYDATAIDRIVALDHTPSRWARMDSGRPPVVAFWYRESPVKLVGSAPAYRVGYTDPPLAVDGMVGVKLDLSGRLLQLDAHPPRDLEVVDPRVVRDVLFRAAGLDTADFREALLDTRSGEEGSRRLFAGRDRASPPHALVVDLTTLGGRPAAFTVQTLPVTRSGAALRGDPSARVTGVVSGLIRPLLLLGALFLGAWLARRNLRAGRGDTSRASKVAAGLMALRVLGRLLGGDLSSSAFTEQFASALAWGLYDFAFGWVSYVAIEPYVRRLWPRFLTTWVRLLDGRHADATVGRDLLVGCVAGTAIALAVAGHQMAPTLFGAPPGRPDGVGFVEDQLTALLGLRHQVADLLALVRSALVHAIGFLVVLVVARLLLRRAWLAVGVSLVIFLPLGLPRGDWPLWNASLALFSLLILAVALFRYGLLAAVTSLMVHSALESAPLGLGGWAASRTTLVLALVLAVGVYGFARSQQGRSVIREVL